MKWLSEVTLAISEEYGTEYSDTRMKMWAGMLNGYSEKQVKDALVQYMRSEQARFAPKVSDIITMIEGSRVDREAIAAQSWQRVMDNCNTTASAVFDDPAIHYAIGISFGSWVRLGLMTEDEAPFRRKDFIAAYCSYKEGLPYPTRLIGRHEQESAKGEVRFTTRHIGDESKCKAVEGGGAARIDGVMEEIDALTENLMSR